MMGTNRKQPFGYRIEQGRVVVNPAEEQWVLHLYRQYSVGVSIRELTEVMNNTGVRYDIEKPWNKNMVARILGDVRYTGENGWPQVVEVDLFRTVGEKKRKKAPAVQKTQAQKILRSKCDHRITPHIEHEVLYLLNSLLTYPEQIKTSNKVTGQLQKVSSLKDELEDMLKQLPVDEEKTKQTLQEVAVAMYEAIDPGEYESDRIRNVFEKEQPRDILDARLIKTSISAVLVEGNGRVRIKLKNDQVIERGE